MLLASFIGDHPAAALLVLALIVAIVAVIGFMTVGLRRLEQDQPDLDSPEAERIRRESHTWWRFWHPYE